MPTDQNLVERSFVEYGGFLRRLATVLIGRHDLADDVVQDAMLTAAEHPPRAGWDMRRWLAGVVRNLVREQRRAERRRTRRELANARADGEPSAADIAARLELSRRIVEATQALPAAYREVVLLRFFEGLPPRAIAARLDVSVHTVRTRLRRALERLRGALDHEYGDRRTWSLMLAPLASPSPAGPMGLAFAGAVIMAMKTKLAVAAVLLCGAFLTFSFLSGVGPFALGRGDGTGAATRLHADGPAAMGDEPGNAPTRTGAAGSRRVQHEQADDSSDVVSTGRLLAAETRAPVSGAEIRVELWDGVKARLRPSWTQPEPVHSDSRGRYRLVVPYDPELQLDVLIDAPGRVVGVSWYGDGHVKAGQRIDHGDVLLPRAVQTMVRVVDERGQPVPDYKIEMHGPPLDLGSSSVQPWRRGLGRTRVDGYFEPLRLWPGTWSLEPGFGQWLEFVGPKLSKLSAGDGGRTVLVHVKRRDGRFGISGRVVDEAGQPIPRIKLAVPARTYGVRVAVSDRRGRFSLTGLVPEKSPYRIRLSDRDQSRRFEIVTPQGRVPVGTNDLDVVVRRRRPGRLRIEVTDEGGAPVEWFAYSMIPVNYLENRTGLNGNAQLSKLRAHPDGVLELERYPGSYLLFVRAGSKSLSPALHEPIELSEGQRVRRTVVLSSWVAWPVRVVDEAGSAVPGARVELREVVGRGERGLEWACPVSGFLEYGTCGSPCSVITASGRTDEEGSLTLRTAHEIGTAELRVTGAGHLPKRVRVGPSPPREGLEIRVERGATVEATLGPEPALRAWGEVTMQLSPVGEQRPELEAVAENDHVFRFAVVPPGDWNLIVGLPIPHDHYRRSVARITGLRAGETRRVEVDIDHLRPARVEVTVLLDGRPPPLPARLELAIGRWNVDEHGRVVVERVPAGRYRPFLRLADGRTVAADSDVVVGAGERMKRTVPFVRRSLTVECVDANGRPAMGERLSLRVHVEANYLFRHLQRPHVTDEHGRVTFDTVPPFPCDIVQWSSDISEAYQLLPRGARTTTLAKDVRVLGESRSVRVTIEGK